MDKNDARDTLNNLLEICYDGHKGYAVAAEKVDDPEYEQLFRQFSDQRRTYAAQLRPLLSYYGGTLEEEGHLLAVFHRAWLNIKVIAAQNDVAALLDECVRGEEIAMAAYVEAFEQDLPDDIRNVVRKQLVGVRDAYERVRALASALAA